MAPRVTVSGLIQNNKGGDSLWFLLLHSSLGVPARAELRVAGAPSDDHPIVQLKDQTGLEG